MQSFGTHVPVLLDEAVNALALEPDGIYLDATYGRGGHAARILSNLSENGRLYALDRDPAAVKQARQKFANEPRFKIFNSDFANVVSVMSEAGLKGEFSGILVDLGVSSPQLDEAERGFSFTRDGPLDMRMDPSSGVSARDWLKTVELGDLIRVFKEFGEERYSPRIARAILSYRESESINTTLRLAEIVKEAHPRWEKGKHPATRVFQAIRIHINGEFDALRALLNGAGELLKKNGRLAVISFHSLEDRMVKRFMRAGFDPVSLPRGLPVHIESSHPFQVVGKPSYPSETEVQENVRARSAVLRVAEKCI